MSLLACAVCYGNLSDPFVIGMNWAILFLLAVVGGVLVGFAVFFLKLRKKEHDMVRVVETKAAEG